MRRALCYLPPQTPHNGQTVALGGSSGDEAFTIVASVDFPPIGSEGDSKGLFSALIPAPRKDGGRAYLGKTAAHFNGSANFGDEGAGREGSSKPFYLLKACVLVPVVALSVTSPEDALQTLPLNVDQLLSEFVWMDARVLIATSKQLLAKSAAAGAHPTHPLGPVHRFVLFVNASSGVVLSGAEGGGDQGDAMMIIRVPHEGGVHPGQWRVGGEASFGWGGQCRLCTSGGAVVQPFDVLCHRPTVPAVLHQFILLPPRPRSLSGGFGGASIDTLRELRNWVPPSLHGVPSLPPIPLRRQHGHGTTRRPVLICHDFKGGYRGSDFPEFVLKGASSSSSSAAKPSDVLSLSELYSVRWWQHAETFVYFTHSRISIPPREWINACHHHGVRCLGTLLFEGGNGASDMFELLETESSVRLHAGHLVRIAVACGFDGYLLNFEAPIVPPAPFQPSNSHATRDTIYRLQMFVAILTQALHAALDDPHSEGPSRRAQVVWYDALTIDGRVSYQNAVTEKNIAFGNMCDGVFTNYWWRPDHLRVSSAVLAKAAVPSPLTSIYGPGAWADRAALVGIDVFGRQTYGGGGYNSGAAVAEIVRSSLGQGVALFAPSWTLECESSSGWNGFQSADARLWSGLEGCCDGTRRGGGAPQLRDSCDIPTPSPLGNPFADSREWGLRRIPFVLNFADSFGVDDESPLPQWSQLSCGDPRLVSSSSVSMCRVPALSIASNTAMSGVLLPFTQGLRLAFSGTSSNSAPPSGSSLLHVCQGPGVTVECREGALLSLCSALVIPKIDGADTTVQWYLSLSLGRDAPASAAKLVCIPRVTANLHYESNVVVSCHSIDLSSLFESPQSSSEALRAVTIFGLSAGLQCPTPQVPGWAGWEVALRQLSLFQGIPFAERVRLEVPRMRVTSAALRRFKDSRLLLDLIFALPSNIGEPDRVFSVLLQARFFATSVDGARDAPFQFLGLHSFEGLDGDSVSSEKNEQSFFMSLGLSAMVGTKELSGSTLDLRVIPSLQCAPGLWREDLQLSIPVPVSN